MITLPPSNVYHVIPYQLHFYIPNIRVRSNRVIIDTRYVIMHN